MTKPASTDTPGQISLLNEVRRKLIHLSSVGVPLIYWFVSQETMLALLIPATLFSLIIEVLRRRYKGFEAWFLSIFGPILRAHESRDSPKVNGATFVLVSATICVALFPKLIAITAFTVLIISDTASALYGRRFGTRKFYRKSLEGSLAFLVTAMMVVALYTWLGGAPWEFVVAGFVASLVATWVEAISHGGSTIDDNLSIPSAFGATRWGALGIMWQMGFDGVAAFL